MFTSFTSIDWGAISILTFSLTGFGFTLGSSFAYALSHERTRKFASNHNAIIKLYRIRNEGVHWKLVMQMRSSSAVKECSNEK